METASVIGSIQRILEKDTDLYTYKVAEMQMLKDSDIQGRIRFAKWVKRHKATVNNIWFTDEAHFQLTVQYNKQNRRHWAYEKPDICAETQLHPAKVTVWAAISSHGIIGPFYFEEDGDTATITSDRYVDMLKRQFLPALKEKQLEEIWFQQDGAAPHTSKAALAWLTETFQQKLISRKTPIEWPAHSPDLTPCDFFLWGYLKERVYAPEPNTLEDLKQAIQREISCITPQMCINVINSFWKRTQLLGARNGQHVEHVL